MTQKELRWVRRANLLEMLVDSEKQIEALKARIAELEETLKSRSIAIEESGSVAEAAFQLNDIFVAAQKTADQYIENVQEKCARIEEESLARETESQEKASRMLADAQQQRDSIVGQARQQSKEIWIDVSDRLQEIVDAYDYLQNMFGRIDLSKVISGQNE